jgi:hypothetical protein
VVLGFTASAGGTATVDVQANPASTRNIGWNQSPGIAEDGVACQVFATFHESEQEVLVGAAAATFVAVEDGTTLAPAEGGLAASGGETVSLIVLLSALAAVVGGALIVVRGRRQHLEFAEDQES